MKIKNIIFILGILITTSELNNLWAECEKEPPQQPKIERKEVKKKISEPKKKKEAPKKKSSKSSTPVTITRYHPVERETNSDPIHTADASEISMAKLRRGKLKWVAVSRDLLQKYGYGAKIRIETGDPDIDGVYEIHDTMNKRWTARVDILTHPKTDPGQGLWEGKIKVVKL